MDIIYGSPLSPREWATMARCRSRRRSPNNEAAVQLAFKFLLLSPLLKSCLSAAAPINPNPLPSPVRPAEEVFCEIPPLLLAAKTDRQTCSVARGSIGHRTTRICVAECIPLPPSSLKSSPDPFREQTEQCNGRYSILESQCSSPSSHARICRLVSVLIVGLSYGARNVLSCRDPL